MASLIIDDLDEETLTALRDRAAGHGRSTEAEAREILSGIVAAEAGPTGREFARRVRKILLDAGGTDDLKLPERPPPRDPPDFRE